MSERAENGNGIVTPLNNLLARVGTWTTQIADEWFGPLRPTPQVAPPNTEVRTRDYSPGENVTQQPRAYENISFNQLRALADNYDIMRGAIETVKDKIVAQPFTFRAKREENETDKAYKARNSADTRIKELAAFWKSPDRENDFRTWLRMILEDLLVIDAPTVCPRFLFDGSPYCFDVVDGATIKRVIDVNGKRPAPPARAYQQVLKGVAAVDLSAPYPQDVRVPQIINRPRNLRAHRAYGMSPVEQCVMTVNIAIRRQLYQLSEYTEGNIPEAIAGVPDNWTPDQISKFEQRWHSLFENNQGRRKKMKFVPWGGSGNGLPIVFPKDKLIKDEADEWLIRVVCFFFSIQPTALVKQMNRGSAQQNADQAVDEGLHPLSAWVTDFVNYIVETYWGYDDVEFSFEQKSEANQKEQADIDEILVKRGIKSVDEAREERGLEPLGMKPAFMKTDGTPLLVEDVVSGKYEEQQNADRESRADALANANGSVSTSGTSTSESDKKKQSAAGTEKVTKGKKKALLVKTSRFTKQMTKEQRLVRSGIEKFFETEAARIAKRISEAYSLTTMKLDEPELKRILDALDLDSWVDLTNTFGDSLTRAAKAGARKALASLGIDSEAAVFDVVDKWAVEFSQRRSAELVGMKVDKDGNVVENPNAQWSITNTTREGIRSLVETAMTDGMTPAELSSAIQEDYLFSASRADMIARTEIAKASVEGNMKGARESGVVSGKKWILGSEHDAECVCDDNADDGLIGLDDEFSSGDDAPPAHPNCVCDVLLYTGDEDQGEDE